MPHVAGPERRGRRLAPLAAVRIFCRESKDHAVFTYQVVMTVSSVGGAEGSLAQRKCARRLLQYVFQTGECTAYIFPAEVQKQRTTPAQADAAVRTHEALKRSDLVRARNVGAVQDFSRVDSSCN